MADATEPGDHEAPGKAPRVLGLDKADSELLLGE
jgi:hypothetical protein